MCELDHGIFYAIYFSIDNLAKMSTSRNISKLVLLLVFALCVVCDSPEEIKRKRAQLIKKHLKRLKKVDGGIKLVGGRGEFEGNVEILHDGSWGAICDDEWDVTEARIICKQLGYPPEKAQPTANSYFGPAKRRFWMDNIYCDGTEEEISQCRFDGWGQNDCTSTESAGVICDEPEEEAKVTSLEVLKPKMVSLPENLKIRLRNGRIKTEGRVEIKTGDNWEVICGDGWSLFEALVVCKSLNMGYASDAMQTDYFGGNLTKNSLGGVKCLGTESSLSHCRHDQHATGHCASKDVAAVSCTHSMADLIIDHMELMSSAHLDDKQMFFLQCAMEENCVASTAYEIQKENPAWHLETRRLLRFTAKIFNAGTADFRPAIPKHLWEWHMCHMHYHSMEVFATFDIFNNKGQRVAEGHKASFCLEDNQCLPGVKPVFACVNYGDQGISVNCSDIYKYTVDCQWVDITDLEPGKYTMKVAVNPEFKVPEMSFENNAAVCDFLYSETYGTVTNCVVQRP
ncbi:lysyl oxidase homolog 2 [Leptinotarsa decemlineata]|uniref:lysyl oxidase homolog 2 n=1 Tax=Leptinotarsa decemlineata TaxID=7539 RepID=UPI003D309085